MRTLIISDLHLGNGGVYDAFAGREELPALLDHFTSPPTRVLVNGDGIDFLMNEDPLELDVARAVAVAEGVVAAPATAGVLVAFGRILAAGGEVVLRLGNHDIELALPEVQAVVRGALGQPAEVAARLHFEMGSAPQILEAGGARVLVTHGEQNDPWNKVDYTHLPGAPGSFEYAPGSRLVKQLLNPLTHVYGLRFANLLKPDFQGAVLTALAVSPGATKLAFQKASVKILWQLFRQMGAAASFADEEEDLGLAGRIDEAGLSADERESLEAELSGSGLSFAGGDDEALGGAQLKLARAGLKLYAGLQRRLAGTASDAYFQLEPAAEEWTEAQRLAKKFGAGAVVIGHTHAARWRHDDGLVFANTGTWISLMSLPPFDAGDDAWAAFIAELRQNPGLDPAKQKVARTFGRFTAVTVEERPGGGATLALVQWEPGTGLRELGSAVVPPASSTSPA